MIVGILLGIVVILLMINIWLSYKKSSPDVSQYLNDIRNGIKLIDTNLEKVDKSIRDDFQRNREESNKIAKENREELTGSLSKFSDSFVVNVRELNKTTSDKLDKIRETVESKLQSLQFFTVILLDRLQF